MYTVVVAEDEWNLRNGLVNNVPWEKLGFQVCGQAENGIEALDLVEKLEPDLLLTDVKMPHMTGIELARNVREIRPNTHIAFLSGYDDFSFAQQAIQYNVVSYMLKPITTDALTLELEKIKKKIDDKFAEFLSNTQTQTRSETISFLMSLIIDSYQEEQGEQNERNLLSKAQECGLIGEETKNTKFVIMVSTFHDEKSGGANCTLPENINAIESVMKKYVKHISFFVGNRIVSLIFESQRNINKYLHILVDDITQSAKRIMDHQTHIGISKTKESLQFCHDAYREAMSALKNCSAEEGGVCYMSDIERLNQDKLASSGSEVCDKALEKIEKEYANSEISLVSLSNDIAISPNYLSAIIRKSTGSTFIDLLTKKRVEKAKELLVTSNLKIREITEQCGYNDQHYFSYSFKKYVGMSPNAFRRQAEEGQAE